jgi:hypothetical protein
MQRMNCNFETDYGVGGLDMLERKKGIFLSTSRMSSWRHAQEEGLVAEAKNLRRFLPQGSYRARTQIRPRYEKERVYTVNPFLSLASDFEREFNSRVDRWRRDTAFHSSLAAKFMHEDYQTIMAMGERVVPLILERLQKYPEPWFWALKHIAKEDVAKSSDSPGDASRLWLKWGRLKGYIR